MATYKIWIEIEEIDEENDVYRTMDEYCDAGSFETDDLDEALSFMSALQDAAAEIEMGVR